MVVTQIGIEWTGWINLKELLDRMVDLGEKRLTSIPKPKSSLKQTSNCHYNLNGVVGCFPEEQVNHLSDRSTAANKGSSEVLV